MSRFFMIFLLAGSVGKRIRRIIVFVHLCVSKCIKSSFHSVKYSMAPIIYIVANMTTPLFCIVFVSYPYQLQTKTTLAS